MSRWRVSRTLSRGRSVASVALAASVAIAVAVPALATVALVAGIWIGLHTYELVWWREQRARRRADSEDGAGDSIRPREVETPSV